MKSLNSYSSSWRSTMNTLVLDSFASFGVAIRPLLIATALFGLWRGLRRTPLPRRTQLVTWLIIAVPLVLWFVLILELARAGFFVARPGGRVPGIPLAVVIPLVAGLLLITRSTRMAAVADATPLSWLIGFQVFRALGSVFLFQWAAGTSWSAFWHCPSPSTSAPGVPAAARSPTRGTGSGSWTWRSPSHSAFCPRRRASSS